LHWRPCFLGGKSITFELGERKSDVSERYKEPVISLNLLSGARGLKHVYKKKRTISASNKAVSGPDLRALKPENV